MKDKAKLVFKFYISTCFPIFLKYEKEPVIKKGEKKDF